MPQKRFFDAQLAHHINHASRDSSQLLNQMQECSLDPQESHHAIHVMRLKKGDTFEVIDGKGCLAEGIVSQVTKKALLYRCTKIDFHPLDATQGVIIQLQAQLAKSKLELVVEKSTELGVDILIVFKAKNSDKQPLTPAFASHLEKKMRAALKQSGRLWMPALVLCENLSELETSLMQADRFQKELLTNASRWVLDLPKRDCPEHTHWKRAGVDVINAANIVALGPEPGWTQAELDQLKEYGFQPTAINSHCLRAETAAISAIATLTTARYLMRQE